MKKILLSIVFLLISTNLSANNDEKFKDELTKVRDSKVKIYKDGDKSTEAKKARRKNILNYLKDLGDKGNKIMKQYKAL